MPIVLKGLELLSHVTIYPAIRFPGNKTRPSVLPKDDEIGLSKAPIIPYNGDLVYSQVSRSDISNLRTEHCITARHRDKSSPRFRSTQRSYAQPRSCIFSIESTLYRVLLNQALAGGRPQQDSRSAALEEKQRYYSQERVDQVRVNT